jgi:hypothetical protein
VVEKQMFPPSLHFYLKSTIINKKMRAGAVTQVVELLFSKYEALNTNPSTTLKQKEPKKSRMDDHAYF